MVHFITTKQNSFQYLPSNYEISNTLTTVKELLKDKVEICLDTETTGLNPLKDKIIMLQLGIEGHQIVIDARDFNITELRELLEDSSKLMVGHNIKFDYNMLKQYDIVLNNVYDTMLVQQVIDCDKYSIDIVKKFKKFSLSGVYKNYFGESLDKTVRDEFLNIGNRPFTLRQIEYGALDVIAPLKIKEKQEAIVALYKLQKVCSLENKVTLALADIEYNGIELNADKWMHAVSIYEKRSLLTEKELDKLVLANKKGSKYKKIGLQFDIFGSVDDKLTSINWNSDSQVLEVLNEVFDIHPKDKYGNDSTGKVAIELLDTRAPIVDLLVKYREESKVISSFGKKFIEEYLNEDGRIHTSFTQIIGTGRVSSKNPNLQQVKGNKDEDEDSKYFREAFCVANNNKTLVVADFSSQESHIMAELADDKDFINFFMSGDNDIHSFVATKLFSASFGREFIVTKKNENKAYRQKGKVLNFSISFGAGAFTIGKKLKIEREEAQGLIDSFYKAFPALKKFFDEAGNYGLQKGHIVTNDITNRIRWIQEWQPYIKLKEKRFRTREEEKELKKLEGAIRRKSQNTKIQGTAADITKTALILLRNHLLSVGIRPLKDAKIKIVNVIHDEIVCESDLNLAESFSKVLQECMEKAARIFCKKVSIPAQPQISSYWTH